MQGGGACLAQGLSFNLWQFSSMGHALLQQEGITTSELGMLAIRAGWICWRLLVGRGLGRRGAASLVVPGLCT
jgi:hypothetical protein